MLWPNTARQIQICEEDWKLLENRFTTDTRRINIIIIMCVSSSWINMKNLPSTRTMQEHSALPAEFSALHRYWPSSSGRALSMVREHRPPAAQQQQQQQHMTTQQQYKTWHDTTKQEKQYNNTTGQNNRTQDNTLSAGFEQVFTSVTTVKVLILHCGNISSQVKVLHSKAYWNYTYHVINTCICSTAVTV